VSESESRPINCSSCGKKHEAVFEVDYKKNPFVAAYNNSEVPFTFNYNCPVTSAPLQVTFYFTSSEAKRFKDASITRIIP